VKETAGQVLYERYAKESGLPFVSFRPQYIYGRKSNKWDYIDWYFDRIVRGAPLPIPGESHLRGRRTASLGMRSLSLLPSLAPTFAIASFALPRQETDPRRSR
jgi:hypothetical protein